MAALTNPVYDVQRLGIYFTASPRHADVLLVTGVGAAGMLGPLRHTFEVMPDPKVVIAAGTDAISGGLIGTGYASLGGVSDAVPVDVFVPGSPPTPFGLLHGILIAVGLLSPSRSKGSSTLARGTPTGRPPRRTHRWRPARERRSDGGRTGLLRGRAGHRSRSGRPKRAVASRPLPPGHGRERVPGHRGCSGHDRRNDECRHHRGLRDRSQRAADRLVGRSVPDAALRHRRVRLGLLRVVGRPSRSRPPARDGFGLRPLARIGRRHHLRGGRLHVPVRLGDADRLVLHAYVGHAGRGATGRCGLVHGRHRQGQRSGAALRLLAHGRAYPQSEHRQLARRRSRRRPRRGLGPGRGRLRRQGGPGAAPGVDPRRLPRRARARPGPPWPGSRPTSVSTGSGASSACWGVRRSGS